MQFYCKDIKIEQWIIKNINSTILATNFGNHLYMDYQNR